MRTPTAAFPYFRKRQATILRWTVLLLLLLVMATSKGASAQSELGRIVFLSSSNGEDGIFVMDADGNNRTRLTTGGMFPIWSPDSCKIAFRHQFFDIYVMDADGSHQTLIWDSPGGDPNFGEGLRLQFSPDGSKILFGRSPFRIVNVDGSDPIDVDSWRWWSPDGSKILFLCGVEICVMNADGTGRQQLEVPGNGMRGSDELSWSPDGTRIALASRTGTGSDVIVMNPDSGTGTSLTTGEWAWMPSWSPDGSRIAFQTIREEGSEVVVLLEVMNSDGRNRVQLADQLPFMLLSWQFSWSPDGSKIVFHRHTLPRNEASPQTPGLDIYTVYADGSNLIRLTTGDHSAYPVWSPTAECED